MEAAHRIAIASLAFAAIATQAQQPQAPATPAKAAEYGKLPISFEANRGQTDPSVQFLSRGSGYSLYLTDSSAVLSLSKAASSGKDCHPEQTGAPADGLSPLGTESEGSGSHPPRQTQSARPCDPASDSIRMELSGANPQAKVAGTDQLPGIANYFLGKDPARWHTNIPTYAKVRYTGVYPGIDLVYYGNQRQLEYDFIVAPNANPNTIQLHFAGAQKISLTPTGDLTIQSKNGQVAFRKPEIYQQTGDKRTEIPGHFRLQAGNAVSFQVGSYDHHQPLVIDPILAYSTYLGGSGDFGDQGYAIAVDSAGSAYIVGATTSADFPVTAGGYQTKYLETTGGSAVFVSKFNAAGTALVYSTFLCGSGAATFSGFGGDRGNAAAVDALGNAYIAGTAYSRDFPTTTGAFQTQNPAQDGEPSGFLAKLNPSGNKLVYSTYLGAKGEPTGTAGGLGTYPSSISVDSAGDAYTAGLTDSAGFPTTPGAFQTASPQGASADSGAVFISKVNPSGTGLVYSTFLGTGYGPNGSYNSAPQPYNPVAIAVDGSGEVFVAGTTASTNHPVTAGARQTVNNAASHGGTNAFISKLDASGSELIYSTYLGGSGTTDPTDGAYGFGDGASGVAVDRSGDAYVTGWAISSNFPVTKGVLQTSPIPQQAVFAASQLNGFAAEFNPAGSALEYSTYLPDVGVSLAIDSKGDAFVAGSALSSYFPQSVDAVLPYAYFPNLVYDGYLMELNPAGNAVLYSTLLGGGEAAATALALDSAGDVYVTGSTVSTDFLTTPGAFQTTNHAQSGASNAFATKLAIPSSEMDQYLTSIAVTESPAKQYQGQPVTLTAKVAGPAGASIPTGTVTFAISNGSLDNVGPYPVAQLDQTGKATWTGSNLPYGTYYLSAGYSGDNTHLATGTESLVQFSVAGGANSIKLLPNLNLYTYGGTQTTLSVAVYDIGGNPLPGVTVNFAGAGLSFSPSQPVTNASGVATTVPSATGAGAYTAVASVSGTAATASIALYFQRAPLYISASNVAVTYGHAAPTPTAYTLHGFVNGDSMSVVSGKPALSTSVTAITPVGFYKIGVATGTLSAANYQFVDTYSAEGEVEVAKAPLTILPASVTIHVGDPLPTFTYAITGFVNGDSQATATTGAPTLTTTAPNTNTPGHYYIVATAGSLAAKNYTFNAPSTATDGILTILPN